MHNNTKNQVLEAVQEYIACAKYVCKLLKEITGDTDNMIGAYRNKSIPKEGYLDGNVYYNFHGVGCYFEMPNTHIDIDFGPKNRCDGFDLYRLNDFYFSRTNANIALSEEDLKSGFNELIAEGIIHNPKWPPSEHLYYLT